MINKQNTENIQNWNDIYKISYYYYLIKKNN